MSNVDHTSSSITRRILKAMSVFGGVQVVGIICSFIRTKIVAMLIGPIGIGLIGLFNSAVELIFSISSLGIRNSSVKDLAAINDEAGRQQMIVVIRRWSYIVGLLGAFVTLLISPLLSRWTFGDSAHTWCFMALSLVLLFNALARGEEAVMQGTSNLSSLAKSLMSGAVLSVIAVVPIYYFFGVSGIVPSLIAISVVVAAAMWLFSRRIATHKAPNTSWRDTLRLGKGFVKLGIFITLSNSVSLLSSYLFISLLNNFAGTAEVGLYQAGFTTINKYADLIFAAMAMEYYPRLSQAAHSNRRISMFVVTQTNVTISILIPVITIFLLCREFVVLVLYSPQFLDIVPYISVAVIGTIFKAVSWCMAFVVLVKGRGVVYLCTETLSAISGLFLNILFYRIAGLNGVGVAYVLWYMLYTLIMVVCCRRMYGLHFHRSIFINGAVALFLSVAVLLSLSTANTLIIIAATILSFFGSILLIKKNFRLK